VILAAFLYANCTPKYTLRDNKICFLYTMLIISTIRKKFVNNQKKTPKKIGELKILLKFGTK